LGDLRTRCGFTLEGDRGMKSPAVCRAGQVSGRERTPKGRIAAEGLSRLAPRSDFDFSMGVFKNEKAPRECNRWPMVGERTGGAKSAARRRSSVAGHRRIGERNVSAVRTFRRNHALWRIIMLRTAFIVGAIAASLLLPTTMLQARGGGGHGGGGHGGGGHGGGGGRGGAVHVGGGGMRMGGGGVRVGGGPGVRAVGGGRRFWHGRWYAYGVGPCWQLTPGGYVWICG
jgi:hypothetical protein